MAIFGLFGLCFSTGRICNNFSQILQRAACLDGDNMTCSAMYLSFELLLTKRSRNYWDDACTPHKVGQEVHTEHLIFLGRGLWLTSLFRSAIHLAEVCAVVRFIARNGNTAIYYQGLPCLR